MCFISLVRYRIKMNYAAACCASVDIGLKCPKSTTVRGREVFLSWNPYRVPRKLLQADSEASDQIRPWSRPFRSWHHGSCSRTVPPWHGTRFITVLTQANSSPWYVNSHYNISVWYKRMPSECCFLLRFPVQNFVRISILPGVPSTTIEYNFVPFCIGLAIPLPAVVLMLFCTTSLQPNLT